MRAFAHHLTFVRSHSRYFTTAVLFTVALLSAKVFSLDWHSHATTPAIQSQDNQASELSNQANLKLQPSETSLFFDLQRLPGSQHGWKFASQAQPPEFSLLFRPQTRYSGPTGGTI